MKPVYWHTIPLAAVAAAGPVTVAFPIVVPMSAAAPPGGPKGEGKRDVRRGRPMGACTWGTLREAAACIAVQ